ncbi:MAG TPA: tetratricopeptide repeat protein [Oligoflexus sp.]|uniref:tetratricopeptide repeat protein n=1 Tax=Oligoflexus sp. TaxID=1971216 RepID=UPI002D5BE7D9|nr:tetratricopeptide repeat protein [Oligoflexus sp.]HYX36541.1 tetratricopeptide repeat protein [Oligoflexus sp.]
MENNQEVNAIILTKRADIRDAVRQAFKAQGIKPAALVSTTDDKEFTEKLEETGYCMVVLDWEYGPDRISQIMTNNRKKSRLESHPVFLIAAHEDDNIVSMAREFFIQYIAVGEVNMDTIRSQIKGLVKDYLNVSPVRKMLLAVESARQSDHIPQAAEMLERLLEKQADNQRVVVELAECYILQNEWGRAETLLKGFINTEDCYARIKHLYARCRLKNGDHAGAIASLKGAQLISPYNVERLIELGNIFLKVDKPEEAEAAFGEVLNFAPGSKEAKIGKSTSKMLMGEVNDALALLNEFASPRELSAVFNTAAILAIRQKRYDAGFELYQKALQILSKKPKLVARILYNMGIGYVKFGKPEKGLKCFEKSAEADPDFADASHNIKILKTATQSPQPRSQVVDEQHELLDGLEERFTTTMPMIDVGTGDDDEVQLDDVLSDIVKVG